MSLTSRFRIPVVLAVTALAACGGGNDTSLADTALGNTAGGSVATDSAAAMGTTSPTTGTLTDPQILALSAAAHQAEIDMSKVAQEQATNAQIKQFAEMMIRDHQRLLDEGNQLAQQANITPAAPANDSTARMLGQMLEGLRAARGAKVDTLYAANQVRAHQNTLEMLQQAQGQATNPQLKQSIERTIPIVQQHLDRAKQLPAANAAQPPQP